MLKQAYVYEAELTGALAEASLNINYRYYAEGFWSFSPDEVGSSEYHASLVSVDEYGEVVGYLHAEIEPFKKAVTSMSAICFGSNRGDKQVFASDCKSFFKYLFGQRGIKR